jgi:hypothetical protein
MAIHDLTFTDEGGYRLHLPRPTSMFGGSYHWPGRVSIT